MQGVNRAFPYVASDDVNSVIEEHTPVLFRLVSVSTLFMAVHFTRACSFQDLSLLSLN